MFSVTYPFAENTADTVRQVRHTDDDGAEVVWRMLENLGGHDSDGDLLRKKKRKEKKRVRDFSD